MRSKILNAIQEGIKLSFMIDPNAEDEKFVKSKISKTEDFIPYDYRVVDLGLSVLWAEYNLGAYPGKTAEDWYGGCYAWAEIEPKQTYEWDTYQFKESLIKYNETDNIKLLLPEDDVATLKLGSMYRMPTQKEFEELCDKTKISNNWVFNYKGISGLNGRLFTSKVSGFKGANLFIPAAGYFNGSKRRDAGSYGAAWSSSINLDYLNGAYYLCFHSSSIKPCYDSNRYCGLSVRAVQDKK